MEYEWISLYAAHNRSSQFINNISICKEAVMLRIFYNADYAATEPFEINDVYYSEMIFMMMTIMFIMKLKSAKTSQSLENHYNLCYFMPSV